jgi:hypothetical protein
MPKFKNNHIGFNLSNKLKNKTEEIDWTKHKMIPVLSWADNETLDNDMVLWLSKEGLYHITFDKWGEGKLPISFEYGMGFKTANEVIKYYS